VDRLYWPPFRPQRTQFHFIAISQICVGVKTTAFPTVYESVADPIKSLLQGRRRKRAVTALNRVSAVLEPNKLYLVLGGPKSGKTSLLKAISGAWFVCLSGGAAGELRLNVHQIRH
jgi:ABC-type polysaccharide/polyol phosphate transport system ATPase subunit